MIPIIRGVGMIGLIGSLFTPQTWNGIDSALDICFSVIKGGIIGFIYALVEDLKDIEKDFTIK